MKDMRENETYAAAFGNFFVNLLNASAGMTAKVVSTVALAKVVSNCFELVAPPPPLSPPIFVLFLLLFLGTSSSKKSIQMEASKVVQSCSKLMKGKKNCVDSWEERGKLMEFESSL